MSIFQYSFQKILDIRMKSREEIEFKYSELNHNLKIEQEELKKLMDYKSFIYNGILDMQVIGTSISEINQYESYLQYLNQQIMNHTNNIFRIEQSIEQIHKELINIKIEEKKWLNLKEKRLEEYNFEQNRAEQYELDEMASRIIKKGV